MLFHSLALDTVLALALIIGELAFAYQVINPSRLPARIVAIFLIMGSMVGLFGATSVTIAATLGLTVTISVLMQLVGAHARAFGSVDRR